MNIFLVICFILHSKILCTSSNVTANKHVNLNLTTDEMIRREGYKAEEHTIVTDDGYILTIYRIPGPPNSTAVLLQHGLTSNSFDWVIAGRHMSLAFILADNGYDVWIGNSRGNTYSRRHKYMSPSEPRFWNFSFHEMGVYDLPAVITHITDIKNNNIIYIGHSMGGTMFYVMSIERPDIADKVKAMFGFAPATFIDHTKSSLGYLIPYTNEIETLFRRQKIYELASRSSLSQFIKNFGCDINLTKSNLCVQIMFAITRESTSHLNFSLIPLIFNHTPAGSSTKTFMHYFQIGKSKKFQYFDYGALENIKLYNNTNPPEYNLSKIQVPIGIFWSKGDFLVDSEDIQRTYKLLPNKILSYKIPSPTFSHLDFIWAKDVVELLYAKVISVIKNYV